MWSKNKKWRSQTLWGAPLVCEGIWRSRWSRRPGQHFSIKSAVKNECLCHLEHRQPTAGALYIHFCPPVSRLYNNGGLMTPPRHDEEERKQGEGCLWQSRPCCSENGESRKQRLHEWTSSLSADVSHSVNLSATSTEEENLKTIHLLFKRYTTRFPRQNKIPATFLQFLLFCSALVAGCRLLQHRDDSED